jgi:hypothetical protein
MIATPTYKGGKWGTYKKLIYCDIIVNENNNNIKIIIIIILK